VPKDASISFSRTLARPKDPLPQRLKSITFRAPSSARLNSLLQNSSGSSVLKGHGFIRAVKWRKINRGFSR